MHVTRIPIKEDMINSRGKKKTQLGQKKMKLYNDGSKRSFKFFSELNFFPCVELLT